MKRLIVFVTLFFIAGLGSLSAQVFDFTLINLSMLDIDEVFIAPSGKPEVAYAPLGLEVLPSKKSIRITLSQDFERELLAHKVKTYRLGIVFKDGSELEAEEIDLAQVSVIEVSLSDENSAKLRYK